MAKEAISPIERHLEKGVLGITVLLFLGVVVKYLLSSPNTLNLSGQEVVPGEIYEMAAGEGQLLRERILKFEMEVPPVSKPDLSSALVAVTPLPSPVPFGPRVPRLQTEESGNMERVSVLPLGKPEVVIGRSGMSLGLPDPVTALPEKIQDYYEKWNELSTQEGPYVMAVNWATVAATFEVAAQARLAREKRYPPGRAVPYLVGAELERREKRWDGTYTEWGPVKTYAPLVLPEVPVVGIEEQEEGKWIVPDEVLPKLKKFKSVVENSDYRLELMRPMPPHVAYGDWWLRAAFKLGGLDLLRLDDEVWFGEQPGDCPMTDRYPTPWKERQKGEGQDMVKVVNDELDKLEEWLKQGCYPAIMNRIDDLRKNSDKYFNDKQRERREALFEQASALLARKKKEEEERIKRKEPEPPRELSPVQVVWVHDTLPDSVTSGRTYQYRMRALLYNNYAGLPQELKDPKDAELVLLKGEWSGPSDDVSIPYDSKFYLTGKKDREQLAKVEVFKWYEGAWYKATFEVGVGDPIGGKAFVKVGEKGEKTRVDFTTGATVVDLDFQRQYRERKERKGAISLDDYKPTITLVYLDSAGELHERLLDVDKKDEGYREMNEKLKKPTETRPPKP